MGNLTTSGNYLTSSGRSTKIEPLSLSGLIQQDLLPQLKPFLNSKDLCCLSATSKYFFQAVWKSLPGVKFLKTVGDDTLIDYLSMVPRKIFPPVLYLDNTAIGDRGAHHLAKLTHIKSLDLVAPLITDASVMSLHPLTRLTSLALTHCTGVSTHGISKLSKLTNLTRLDLQSSTSGSAEGVHTLKHLTKLTSLDLGALRMSDKALAQLYPLTNLEYLGLGLCGAITDAGIGYISGFTGLTSLDLSASDQITESAASYLVPLTNLTQLNLSWSDITDDYVAYLRCLTALRHLDIHMGQTTDEALRNIGGLTNLTKLDITSLSGPYTGEGLIFLSNFTKLADLRLNQFDDSGLIHLLPLTNLSALFIGGAKFWASFFAGDDHSLPFGPLSYKDSI